MRLGRAATRRRARDDARIGRPQVATGRSLARAQRPERDLDRSCAVPGRIQPVLLGNLRYFTKRLNPAGIAKLQEVRGPYYRLLSRIFRDSDGKALRDQVAFLDTVRTRITETLRAG